MVICGLITLSMLQGLFAPNAITQMMFGLDTEGPYRAIIVPNWSVLVGLGGAMLVFGAFNPQSRRLCLAVPGLSKLSFLILAFTQGQVYFDMMIVPIIVDSVMVALFAIFLIAGFVRPTAPLATAA
jgi:hypothetical protein